MIFAVDGAVSLIDVEQIIECTPDQHEVGKGRVAMSSAHKRAHEPHRGLDIQSSLHFYTPAAQSESFGDFSLSFDTKPG